MDKAKVKKDEFDMLIGKIKKNKSTKEIVSNNTTNNQLILAPIHKNEKNKNLKISDSDSTDSSSDFDDFTTTEESDSISSKSISDETDTDDNKKRKQKRKSKKEKSVKDKKKNDEIKDKRIKKDKKEKEKQKNKQKSISKPSQPPQPIINNRKVFRNRNRNNENTNFVDPSTIVFEIPPPPPVIEQPKEVNNVVTANISNTSNVIDKNIKLEIENHESNFIFIDYKVHNSNDIIIEKSMNIIYNDDNYDSYNIKLPFENNDGKFIEIINLSNINNFILHSNNNIKNCEKLENDKYNCNISKNLKLLFHNHEWLCISSN
jgi:hypothetical protein